MRDTKGMKFTLISSGLFKVLQKIGVVAYKLELPPSRIRMTWTFFMLRTLVSVSNGGVK